jgi:hypothetical protein
MSKKMTREQLERLLQDAQVDYFQWGIMGFSKPLDRLYLENQNGDSRLEVENGRVIRLAESVHVTVTYKQYTLQEVRTEWKDGRERRRLPRGSVSGLREGSETPEEAAVRELKEELQLVIDSSRLVVETKELNGGVVEKKEFRGDVESESYPGLISRFFEHYYLLELTDSEFREEGYKEIQEDKTVFFVWK